MMLIRCSCGPSMNSCSWLCWSTGPSAATGAVPWPSFAEALRPQLREPGAQASEPVRVGHHHLDLDAALAGEADGDRRAHRGREAARGFGGQQRIDHLAGAGAHGVRVEAARHGRQQADVGQDRVAAADAGVMVEEGDAVRLEQRAQAVGSCRRRRAR